MSLGLVRQCRAFSAVHRKPGSHVQKNLLAQAKGEEVLQEGGHSVKMWVISKLENKPKCLCSRMEEKGDHIQP